MDDQELKFGGNGIRPLTPAGQAQEAQRRAAVNIALAARAVKVCEHHPDVLLQGTEDIARAYRLGNFRFGADELIDVFDSAYQIVDAIKAIAREVLCDCPKCQKPTPPTRRSKRN